DAGDRVRVVGALGRQYADAAHALGLLRTRNERQRCRTGEARDERAPLHSITSSARASSAGGTLSPSALAVLRLITSSYLVGAGAGAWARCSPLGMRST